MKLRTQLLAWTLLLITGVAGAFKVQFTVSIFGVGPGIPIHENITEDALSNIRIYAKDGSLYKISSSTIGAIQEENTENDELGLSYGQLHFDDSRLLESARFVYDSVYRAIEAYKSTGLDSCVTKFEDPSNPVSGSCPLAGDSWFSGRIDGRTVNVNIGAATHTAQDFFAHSTWVEINNRMQAFDCIDGSSPKCQLDELANFLPIPKLGLEENPFINPSFANVTFGTESLRLVNDDPLNTIGDGNDQDLCAFSSIKDNLKLSSAYWDNGMGPLGGYGPKGGDKGYFTDNWGRATWPNGRCVHGFDDTRGLNKDTEARPNHFKARNAAMIATRTLMNHFLAQANVVQNGLSIGILEKISDSSGQVPAISKVQRYTGTDFATSDPRFGRVFIFEAPPEISYAGALMVKFVEPNGRTDECKFLNDLKGTSQKRVVCDVVTDTARLTIAQRANPSFLLFDKPDLLFSCNSDPSKCAKIVLSNQSPAVAESFVISIDNMITEIKTIIWDFGLFVAKEISGTFNNTVYGTSSGTQTVKATYKNADGYALGTSSASVSIAQGIVNLTATIALVEADSSGSRVEVASGASTLDATPVLSGTISANLPVFHNVRIYDGTTQLLGAANVTGTSWTYTAPALSQGVHSFFAKVERGDGVPGPSSTAYSVSIGPNATVTSVTPNTAIIGTSTPFTVTGQGLPSTAVMSIADGTCGTPTASTPNGFSVSCVPGGPAGPKVVTIKTNTLANSGAVIDQTRIVTVSSASLGTTLVVPATSYPGVVFTNTLGTSASCSIAATGIWTNGGGTLYKDANGYVGLACGTGCRAPTAPSHSLLMVKRSGGADTSAVFIGSSNTVTLAAAETVYFSTNDGAQPYAGQPNAYFDNSGSMTLTISCTN